MLPESIRTILNRLDVQDKELSWKFQDNKRKIELNLVWTLKKRHQKWQNKAQTPSPKTASSMLPKATAGSKSSGTVNKEVVMPVKTPSKRSDSDVSAASIVNDSGYSKPESLLLLDPLPTPLGASPNKKKKKSPSRVKRDRERLERYRQQKKRLKQNSKFLKSHIAENVDVKGIFNHDRLRLYPGKFNVSDEEIRSHFPHGICTRSTLVTETMTVGDVKKDIFNYLHHGLDFPMSGPDCIQLHQIAATYTVLRDTGSCPALVDLDNDLLLSQILLNKEFPVYSVIFDACFDVTSDVSDLSDSDLSECESTNPDHLD